eukprot:gnl/TRDRNA2_/TRDRNA2_145955_c1_seq1.p1 gnl/TRDRNA2_/TRDRNA2_145955_c1~~gnl/TRDRNA2_/TRDRNA2_145955_c1_seq1.p1  ORF type:complete len:124 (+),score=1.82 gnl/TRDRNA2_/TRDRNA2_145955_c1_seq1:108-479(+)
MISSHSNVCPKGLRATATCESFLFQLCARLIASCAEILLLHDINLCYHGEHCGQPKESEDVRALLYLGRCSQHCRRGALLTIVNRSSSSIRRSALRRDEADYCSATIFHYFPLAPLFSTPMSS